MFTGKQVFIRTKITENRRLFNEAFAGACPGAWSQEPRGRLVRAAVRGTVRAGGFPAALSEPAAAGGTVSGGAGQLTSAGRRAQ